MTKKEFMALAAKCDRPEVGMFNLTKRMISLTLTSRSPFDSRWNGSSKTNVIWIDDARGSRSAEKKAAKYRRWLDNNI